MLVQRLTRWLSGVKMCERVVGDESGRGNRVGCVEPAYHAALGAVFGYREQQR